MSRLAVRICLLISFFPMLFASSSCRPPPDGSEEVPPGLPAANSDYTDIAPCWSHDGRSIAFLRATPDRRHRLMLGSANLRRTQPLLPPELVSPDLMLNASRRTYRSPDTLAWSHDDDRIAFPRICWTHLEDGEHLPGTDLWSYDIATGHLEPLALHRTRTPSLFNTYHSPAWSQDDRYLTFVGEGSQGQRSIFVRALKAQNALSVTARYDTYQDSDWPTWRTGHTGHQELVFRQGIVHTFAAPRTETLRRICPGAPDLRLSGELWRMRGRDYARLLPRSLQSAGAAPRAGHFAWSPNGKRLAFTFTPDGADFDRYELWLIDADGAGAHRVSPYDGRGYIDPIWIDPDHLGALCPLASKGFDVVLLPVHAGRRQTLGRIPTADCDWSPDRSHIVYAPTEHPVPPHTGTTLCLFDTHLAGRYPFKS